MPRQRRRWERIRCKIHTAGTVADRMPDSIPENYWNADADALVQRLGTTRDGLSAADAAGRLNEYGPNQVREHGRLTRTRVLVNQIRNPLLLVLVFAAVASAITGEWVDAVIVVVIVLATVGIGYAREYHAETAAAALGSLQVSHTQRCKWPFRLALPLDCCSES